MITEHQTTLAMLDGVDRFVDSVGKALMADFRDLPTFWDKMRRAEHIRELQLFSRVMLLERCDALPAAMRTAAVEQKVAAQRKIVTFAEVEREQRQTAFGHQGLPNTLKSIGWTSAPLEWGPPPLDLIEDSARQFMLMFEDFGVIEPVPVLWEEGLTPADMPVEYREAMRREQYLPSFHEACDTRCEWVRFFLIGSGGATDPLKWRLLFGMVPRWHR